MSMQPYEQSRQFILDRKITRAVLDLTAGLELFVLSWTQCSILHEFVSATPFAGCKFRDN